MAITTAQAWSTLVTTGEIGGSTLTIGSGDNRLLVVALWAQTVSAGDLSVNTFTVGGQSYTGFVHQFGDLNEDANLHLFWFDESTIAAMSGSTADWDDSATPDDYKTHGYATFAGVNQTSPVTSSNSGTTSNSNSEDITTTSASTDHIIIQIERDSNNRDITDWDTLTEVYDAAGADTFRACLADGAGGDNVTSVTGDGINGSWDWCVAVLHQATTSLPGMHGANRGIMRGVARGIG